MSGDLAAELALEEDLEAVATAKREFAEAEAEDAKDEAANNLLSDHGSHYSPLVNEFLGYNN